MGLVLALTGSAGAAAFEKGPYLQNVSKTSVTVMWETDESGPGTVTLLTDPPRTFASGEDEIREVVVDGLEAGHRYRFAVDMGGERVSGEFATAPESGSPFFFVVFGDSRSNVSAHEQVVRRVRREIPDFILATGDMVNEGASEHDWQLFFDVERDLLRENVMYPAVGNHDRQGRGRTADNYRKYFALPENSPDPERYYAFTYGSARFLVLDSNAYSFALTDQTAWIEQELQAARLDSDIRHIFVTMHHPPFSVSLHGGQEELREAWTPLFEKYQVAAVFSGHDHVYSRAEKHGVRYFVSGGGGAPLYPRRKRSDSIDLDATRFFERVNHYLRVHVVGEHIEITAVRADGTVIESVSFGEPPSPKEALLALAAPSTDAAPSMRAAAAGAGEAPATTNRLGGLALLGALVTLLAGGVVVWTLRS